MARLPLALIALLLSAGPVAAQGRTPASAAPAEPSRDAREASRRIDTNDLRAHIAFLADDALAGRAPGTRGADVAASYIAAQLQRVGAQPVRGGYLQRVTLRGWRADTSATRIFTARGTGPLTLRQGRDVMIWLNGSSDSATVRGELVFAGYGTRAAEWDWDDFEGRDVRGRVLVVLSGEPPAPPGMAQAFDGPAMTWYGRYAYKLEEARRRGAAAVLLVHTDAGAGYGWDVVRSSWAGEQLSLPQDIQTPLRAQGWVSFSGARRLLAAMQLDLDELYVRAARRDFQPVFTGMEVTVQARGRSRMLQSSNVVAVVPGSDPALRTQHVVYTAHYDGLGIGAPVDGDSIYNGAYDNASGVAALLELAQAFASMAEAPARSVMFLFATAEEAGMLGSEWYVRNPLVPLARTTAVLNIDGANLWGETSDIGAIGIERSTLGLTVAAQAAAAGLRAMPERAPALGGFFRSDHFPFARAGIPAISFEHGTDFRNRPAGWGNATLGLYFSTAYHLPGDAFLPAMDLSGAVQQARFAFFTGLDVADTARPPRWYADGATGLSDGR